MKVTNENTINKLTNLERKLAEEGLNIIQIYGRNWFRLSMPQDRIFFNEKFFDVIRTHPEELRVIKCISSTHIYTNFSQPWGQRMLTKCYPTSQGCSCDFQRLKV